MPAWLVPAISGVASLGSSLLGNLGAKKREQEARDFNLEQWNRQNAYNHPTEQMARLKQAGLNPNMIYGGSPGQATGNAGAVAPGKAPEYNVNNPIQALDFEKAKNLRAQTNLTQANDELVAGRIQGQIIQNAIGSNDKNLSDYALQLKKEKLSQELKGIKADVLIKGLNADHLSQTQKARIRDTFVRYKLNRYKTEPAKMMSDLAKHGLTIHDPKIMRLITKASENPEEMDKFVNNLLKFGGQTIGSTLGAFGDLLSPSLGVPLKYLGQQIKN